MKRIVEFNSIREPIVPSPGFAKKALSSFKLDLMGLCEFACSYCSSNAGNYLRINRRAFQAETERQLGEPLLPADEPDLMFVWPDVLQRLDEQLQRKPRDWGAGKTLVFSMLTDGFSPYLVKHGITRRALEMVLTHTAFRIRILTKNAVVGSDFWLRFFEQWQDRVVVGLSIGTLDNDWARRIEHGTSLPSARVKALHRLQDAAIPTYGMVCPIFPDLLSSGTLEHLIETMKPHRLETLWAEPFNDRANWEKVRAGYAPDSDGYRWLTDIYANGQRSSWSSYARSLYERLVAHGNQHGWVDKLNYLLYEKDITPSDAVSMAPFQHILLQGTTQDDGRSKNVAINTLQRQVAV